MSEPTRWLKDPSADEAVRRLLASRASAKPSEGLPDDISSDVRDRVWRRLAVRSRPRKHWALWAAPAAAAAAAAFVLGTWGSEPPASDSVTEPRVVRISERMVAAPEDEVRDVELPAFESFQIKPGSQVRLLSEGDRGVELMKGELQFVARPDRPSFVLVAAPYAFRVHRGAAKVSRVGGRLSVRVTRGSMELLRPGKPSELPAGSSIVFDAPPADEETKSAEFEPTSEAADLNQDEASPMEPEVVPDEPGVLYRAARETANVDESQRLFARVAEAGSPWSDVAVLRAIRIDVDRGDYESALARMEEADSQMEESPFRPEFELDWIECLMRLGRHERARTRAEGFATRFPEHPRAEEVRALAWPEGPL